MCVTGERKIQLLATDDIGIYIFGQKRKIL